MTGWGFVELVGYDLKQPESGQERSNGSGQVPWRGVRVGHPIDVCYATVDRVNGTSDSASGILGTPDMR